MPTSSRPAFRQISNSRALVKLMDHVRAPAISCVCN